MGHVIMDGANDGSDTDFLRGPNYLNARETRNCFPVLRELVAKYGAPHVAIVSKCGRGTQQRTLEWLDHNKVYAQTGILPANVYFCRMVEEKGPICLKLGLDVFIDDRLKVLYHIHKVDPGVLQILFGNQERDRREFAHHLSRVRHALDWDEVGEILL